MSLFRKLIGAEARDRAARIRVAQHNEEELALQGLSTARACVRRHVPALQRIAFDTERPVALRVQAVHAINMINPDMEGGRS
jgi:hypothetical protein